jgi:hypothetical protein
LNSNDLSVGCSVLVDLLKFSIRALFSKIICLVVVYFLLTLGGIPCIFSPLEDAPECSESLEAKFAHIIVRLVFLAVRFCHAPVPFQMFGEV